MFAKKTYRETRWLEELIRKSKLYDSYVSVILGEEINYYTPKVNIRVQDGSGKWHNVLTFNTCASLSTPDEMIRIHFYCPHESNEVSVVHGRRIHRIHFPTSEGHRVVLADSQGD